MKQTEIKVSQLVSLLKKMPQGMSINGAMLATILKGEVFYPVGSPVLANFDGKVNAIGLYKGLSEDGKHMVVFGDKTVERAEILKCTMAGAIKPLGA